MENMTSTDILVVSSSHMKILFEYGVTGFSPFLTNGILLELWSCCLPLTTIYFVLNRLNINRRNFYIGARYLESN
jgi:hypothetical protein